MSRWQAKVFTGGGGGPPPPEVTDHFAPTVIVGNVLAGDPAVAQAAPFQYIPDPGDGTGIAAALAAVALIGGWVHIRRGPYTLDAAVLPLTVPKNTRVTGDGSATVLFARDDDRRVFAMVGALSEVSHLQVLLPPPAAGAVGAAVIDALASTSARIANLAISGGADLDPNESLDAFINAGVGSFIEGVRLSGPRVVPQVGQLALVRVSGFAPNTRVRDSDLNGGDWNVFVETGPAPSGILVHDNKLQCSGVAIVHVGTAVFASAVQDNYMVASQGTLGILWSGSGVIKGNTTISGLTIALDVDSFSTICVGNQATVFDAGGGNEVAHNIPT